MIQKLALKKQRTWKSIFIEPTNKTGMKLTEDDVYFIDVDDDKGGIDERGILISCNHEDENSLFGECKKCDEIKSEILKKFNK